LLSVIARKSQKAAQGLCADGFRVIIYGEEDHPEVMGVLAWTEGLDPEAEIDMPRRTLALLAQTTKSEQSFAEFVGRLAVRNIGRISELRLVERLEKLAEMLHAKEQRALRLPLSNLIDA
jgi:4-hydroxy-3-methylbut-2-enyl diphosphate reductase IspH